MTSSFNDFPMPFGVSGLAGRLADQSGLAIFLMLASLLAFALSIWIVRMQHRS